MQTIKGKVSKIKILKLSTRPLVHFKIDDVSCLIASNSLNFLYDVKENDYVVVGGEYNARNQFIIKKYCVTNASMPV